jgi:hypothetical protein
MTDVSILSFEVELMNKRAYDVDYEDSCSVEGHDYVVPAVFDLWLSP